MQRSSKLRIPGSIKFRKLIALLAEDGEDWKTVPASSVGDATADAAPPVVAATGGSTPGTVINMPSLSPTTEGTIVQWYKERELCW